MPVRARRLRRTGGGPTDTRTRSGMGIRITSFGRSGVSSSSTARLPNSKCGIATLVSDTGERFSTPVKGATVAEGDVLHCCVRRDRVELERAPRHPAGQPERTNAVVGAVRSIEYQGSYVKVTIDVPGREQFVANVADSRFFANPVDIGDPVLARWAPEDVHLLTGDLRRPGRGMSAGRPYGEEITRENG